MDDIDFGGGGDQRQGVVEGRRTASEEEINLRVKIDSMISPYEPPIMSLQSLLVWERPWKSAIFFGIIHIMFWFICTTSARFFFLVSIFVMAVVFFDTWKNRIWPEIRVSPVEPEDAYGWTPVHPRLLSVPELSSQLAHFCCGVNGTFLWLRGLRVSHPLVFCLGNSLVFALTALMGHYISGLALTYLFLMVLMLWPMVSYNALMRKAWMKVASLFGRMFSFVLRKFYFIITLGGRLYIPEFMTRSRQGGEKVEGFEEEDFMPKGGEPELIAALSRAISDSGDEGSTGTTPRMSKAPSFNNILDADDDKNDNHFEADFELDLNQMPSFDDLDNTDDELEFSTLSPPPKTTRRVSREGLQFTPRHFSEVDNDDDLSLSHGLDFSSQNTQRSLRNSAAPVGLAEAAQAAQNALTGALVAQTLSSMMDSALTSMSTMGQGQNASSSSRVAKTGAKMTYTRSNEGESIDFQNPEPTIEESDEEYSDEYSDDEEEEGGQGRGRSDQIAEIENSFDFLDDLDPDSTDKGE